MSNFKILLNFFNNCNLKTEKSEKIIKIKLISQKTVKIWNIYLTLSSFDK
jgi:hypothetical protein